MVGGTVINKLTGKPIGNVHDEEDNHKRRD